MPDLTTRPLTPDPQITRYPVQSSMLAEVGYDEDTQTLEVQFKSRKEPGPVWRYYGVPGWVFDELISAAISKSRGSFFTREVKNGPYKGEKVEG